jgi:hypothetical protein
MRIKIYLKYNYKNKKQKKKYLKMRCHIFKLNKPNKKFKSLTSHMHKFSSPTKRHHHFRVLFVSGALS